MPCSFPPLPFTMVRRVAGALCLLSYTCDALAGGLPGEIEPNNSTVQANDASENFATLAGNLYHMGFSGNLSTGTDADYFNIGQ